MYLFESWKLTLTFSVCVFCIILFNSVLLMITIEACILLTFTPYFVFAYGIEDRLNVGSILFSASDLKKKDWDNIDLSLLEARRYFQELIPSAINVNPSDENYVQDLLSYFNDAYITIKKEARNKVSENIMTAALSDAIGGYLKSYILPVTKYGFYGGTVDENDAIDIFNLYNEILQYMETDGFGWREPNAAYLESTAPQIVARSRRLQRTRSMDNACDQLVTYDTTTAGLNVPTPLVTWTDELSVMILPLKNHSFIVLDASDPSGSLLNYYHAAKDCLHSNNPQTEYEFDNKMQSWLADEVMPHLSDDRLYLALNSVLTIVNDTRGICFNLLKKLNLQNSSFFSHTHLSKKVLILIVILLLELISFIPAVFFILCCRTKLKRNSNGHTTIDSDSSVCNMYKTISKRHTEESYFSRDDQTDFTDVGRSEAKTQYPSYIDSKDDQPNVQPDDQPDEKTDERSNNQLDDTTVGTSVPSSLMCTTKHCSTEIFRIINESKIIPKKSSLRRTSSRENSTVPSQFTSEQFIPNVESLHSRYKYIPPASKASVKSMTTVRELKSSNTFTLINDCERSMEKQDMFHNKPIKKKSSSQEKALETRISFHEIGHSSSVQKKISQKQISIQNSCIEEKINTQGKQIDTSRNSQSSISEKKSSIKNKSSEESQYQEDIIKKRFVPKPSLTSKEEYAQLTLSTVTCDETLKSAIDHEIESQIARAKSQFHERKGEVNSNIGLKIKTTKKPYFEIEFHRPLTKITVGLDGDIENYKPSKIPKRTVRDFAIFTKTIHHSFALPEPKRKSLIPLPKKRAIVDDIFINKNNSETNDRLNVTL